MHKRRREERDARATPRKTHRECREEKEILFSSAAPFLLRTQLGGRGGRLGCSLERAPHCLPSPFLRREKRSQQSGETTTSRKRNYEREGRERRDGGQAQPRPPPRHQPVSRQLPRLHGLQCVRERSASVSDPLSSVAPSKGGLSVAVCQRDRPGQGPGSAATNGSGRFELGLGIPDGLWTLPGYPSPLVQNVGFRRDLEPPRQMPSFPLPFGSHIILFACCRQTEFFARLCLKIFCGSLCALQNSP